MSVYLLGLFALSFLFQWAQAANAQEPTFFGLMVRPLPLVKSPRTFRL